MPTLRRTPNNPNGSLVDDPLDAIESGNRNANMQAAWQNNSMQQNSAMTQLALQKLRSDDYHFGQNRADNMSMFRADLGARNHALDVNAGLTREGWGNQTAMATKQFDYMAGRDTAADTWRNKIHEEEQPMRTAQMGMYSAQTQAALAALSRDEAARKRADEAGAGAQPPTFTNDNERGQYTADLSAGLNPAQAGVAARTRQDAKAADELQVEEGAIAGDLRTFSEKDNRALGWDPSEGDADMLAQRIAMLEEKLRTKLHKDPTTAHEEANNLVRQNTRQSANSGKVDRVRKLRGLPE